MTPEEILKALSNGDGENTLIIHMKQMTVNVSDPDYAAATLLLQLMEMDWTVGFTLKVLLAATWWTTYFASIPHEGESDG